MIVEFTGESGCGKTTIARKAIELLPDACGKQSLSARENMACLWRVVRNNKTRALYTNTLKLMISVNGVSRLFKNILYAAGVFNYLLWDTPDTVYIIDQGILQLFQSIYYNTDISECKHISSIIGRLVDNNDLYAVACTCSYDMCVKRIEYRKNHGDGIKRRAEKMDEALFDLHRKNLNKVVSEIPVERYILVDTEQDLSENTKRICDFIESRRKH